MSKVDNTVDDAKKLVMRCKALEAQLRQSIPKKEHHEIVLEFEEKMTDMERKIADQEKKIIEDEKELERIRAELQKTNVVNRQLGEVGEQIAVLHKMVVLQGKTVDSLVSKISGTVPTAVHQQSLAKVKELEEQIKGMVSRSEYSALETSYEDAKQQVVSMVPLTDYDSLKQKVQELENAISAMVPKEQFISSEARAKELEAKLTERIPQSMYDELVSKVVQLAEDVTSGEPIVAEQGTSSQGVRVEAAPSLGAEPVPDRPADTLTPSTFVPEETISTTTGSEVKPEVSVPPTEIGSAPEISEIGSQLAEMRTDAFAGAEDSLEEKPLPPESHAVGSEKQKSAEPKEGSSVATETVEQPKVQSG
jgi:hypothetical protein